jgi:glycosyltransferase involved in cell wall biosynthesis
MKVVHIITDLDVGGAEKMLARLVGAFDPARIQSAVVVLGSEGAVSDSIRDAGVPVFPLHMRRDRVSLLALWRLVRLLRRLQPDIVQTWLYHADLAGLVAGTIARAPHIVWNIRCADLDLKDHPRSLPAVLRALAFTSRWPTAVICNSDAGRVAHEALGYMPKRWIIAPNGFDTRAFRPEPEARMDLRQRLSIHADAAVVGLLARLHPMKDHVTFLRAARIVANHRPDVRLVAAGRGVPESDALAELMATLDLKEVVRLWPEESNPSRFLAGLDIAVSSSYSEAFPNVVGEAMACGVPAVVTDVGDSAAIVGSTGRVVPPRDPEALAHAILDVLALDPASYARLAEAARDRIVSEFSIARAADRYESLYTGLVAATPSSADQPACAG